ncbi:MAG: hypothetical protein ACAI44_22395, partial [Candidatus Sericytochromatia bacterium]
NFQTAGLMYSDAGIEAKLITGAFYQPSRDLMVRAGLASGVDLGKIDGTDVLTQVRNVAESDAYLDVSFSKGKVAGNVLVDVPLHQPTQYKIGAGLALAPLKSDLLVLGATYLQEQIVTDVVDRVRLGAEVRPFRDVALGANVTGSLIGENSQDLSADTYLRFSF